MKERQGPQDERWTGAMALSVVGCVVTVLIAAAPADGWQWDDWSVRLEHPAPWREILTPNAPPLIVPRLKPEDVSDLLDEYDAGWDAATALADTAVALTDTVRYPEGPADVTLREATLAQVGDSTADPTGPVVEHGAEATVQPRRQSAPVIPDAAKLPEVLRLTIPEAARPAFGRLFGQLQEHGDIDVLHYGDSQIEGDRISGVMRHAWQGRWGGYGPGLQAAVPLVQSFAVRQRNFGSWQRHTRYGRRDTTDADERYGILACYADLVDSTDGPHCLELAPEPRNHPQFGRWDGVRLWYDSVATDCIVTLDDQAGDTLSAGSPAGYIDLIPTRADTATTPSSANLICFAGKAPRLFGLQPLGGGVQWHGVPMRGSSGTLFRKLERKHFARQLQTVAPELVVLQYGGNVVPHCKDSAQAERYGSWFSSQIRLFKKLLPEAAILVIGPSDMAEKRGATWTSFPRLLDVRNALKRSALAEGVGYWDLLEVMGGVGSMPAWVDSEPALAGPDHVHFTPLGAKRVGTLLDRAFLACYSEWLRDWSKPPPPVMTKRTVAPVTAQPITPVMLETDGLH